MAGQAMAGPPAAGDTQENGKAGDARTPDAPRYRRGE